jgi:hypothetical protein
MSAMLQTTSADLLFQQIKNSIEGMEARDRLHHTKIEELEAQGFRIIDGGQIDDDGWEYTDWRTGEVLARGTGDDSGIGKGERWYHIDRVHDDAGIYAVKVAGIPESLASDIEAWVLEHEQEARDFIAGHQP